jgi:hypothetical protein
MFFIFIGLHLTHPLFACEEQAACDKCAKASEYSWNPSNKYVTARLQRFYELDNQITEAFISNEYDLAKTLTAEYLELASIYRCNWNYGNAIHDANRILGLISLKHGKVDDAADYLLKAGNSTGSPQLDSFGPELDLANELLKLGRTKEVLVYLKDIKSFWEMNDGRIDKWVGEIEKGEKPKISRFSSHPRFWQLLIFWVLALWPILIAAIFLLTLWSRIHKKWFFGITSIAAGYIAMLGVNWLSTSMLMVVVSKLSQSGSESLLTLTIYAFMGVGYIIPIIVVFILSRYFVTKNAAVS